MRERRLFGQGPHAAHAWCARGPLQLRQGAGGAEGEEVPGYSPIQRSAAELAACLLALIVITTAAAGAGLVVHDAGAYCMAMASTYNLKVSAGARTVREGPGVALQRLTGHK